VDPQGPSFVDLVDKATVNTLKQWVPQEALDAGTCIIGAFPPAHPRVTV
jgi:hypothetical protein